LTTYPASKRREVLFMPAPTQALTGVVNRFNREGIDFNWVNDQRELASRVAQMPPFLLILDLSRLEASVLELLNEIEDCLRRCKTIIFGRDNGLSELFVKSLQDVIFLQNVVEPPILCVALERILNDGWEAFKRNCGLRSPYYLLFCHNKKMDKIKAVLDQAAPTDISVLIHGERGTGKELVAKAIHFKSRRWNKAFVKVNCGSMPREVLESELFGLEDGMGVRVKKPGSFEIANQGTIFLDGIEGADGSLQERLLQVLRDGEFSRHEGQQSISINARLVAACQMDLREAVDEGRFLEDLYDWLNVVNISVPPLRERREEIPSLTQYFLDHYSAQLARSYPSLSRETEEFFMTYGWPSNVRELENAVKRIVVLNNEELVVRELRGETHIETEPLSSIDPGHQLPGGGEVDLKDVGRRAAKKAEKEAIQRALDESRWNRRETADRLQVSYKALLYKIKEYGLDE
jgi:DNA-binding NtrC family response regulator